ncbi:uncharacterized protein LOC143235605 [Tachypleus tridentatus]|uniref:uncharacterized protein LOC143235605 n=1 Tax=Tachypleus tridentatus TaxID=6853 RepID=UPI003FCF260D
MLQKPQTADRWSRNLPSILTWCLCFLLFVSLADGIELDNDLTFEDTLNTIKTSDPVDPLNKPHVQSKKREKRFLGFFEYDNDDEDSDIQGQPSGAGEVLDSDSEHLHIGSGDGDTPVYFRMALTFTNIDYKNEYADRNSLEFKNLAVEIQLALQELYQDIPGEQAVTVVSLKMLFLRTPHILIVELGSYYHTWFPVTELVTEAFFYRV